MSRSGVAGVGSRKVIMLLIILSVEGSVYTCVLEHDIRLFNETEK